MILIRVKLQRSCEKSNILHTEITEHYLNLYLHFISFFYTENAQTFQMESTDKYILLYCQYHDTFLNRKWNTFVEEQMYYWWIRKHLQHTA